MGTRVTPPRHRSILPEAGSRPWHGGIGCRMGGIILMSHHFGDLAQGVQARIAGPAARTAAGARRRVS